MSEDQTQATEGWYPDPDDATKHRYWDGKAWTSERREAPHDADLNTAGPAAYSSDRPPASHGGQETAPHLVRRVCRKCSATSETVSTVHNCPECDAPFIRPPLYKSRAVQVMGGVLTLALVIGAGIAVAQQNAENKRQQAAVAAAAAEAQRQKEADEAAAQAAAQQAAEAQQARELEVQIRQTTVKDIQRSVTKMAQGHASDGMLDSWPKRTRCTPVAGQSIENLNRTSTSFECFVITDDNADGTYSGYNYHALMNWDTGQYTYGFGKP